MVIKTTLERTNVYHCTVINNLRFRHIKVPIRVIVVALSLLIQFDDNYSNQTKPKHPHQQQHHQK